MVNERVTNSFINLAYGLLFIVRMDCFRSKKVSYPFQMMYNILEDGVPHILNNI